MAVDLTLLIPIHGTLAPPACCHTMLSLDAPWGGLLESRRVMQPQPIPAGEDAPARVSGFVATGEDGESRYGDVTHDAYGKPLTQAPAARVARALKRWAKADWPQTQAAAAFLSALPPDWPVVLYWH